MHAGEIVRKAAQVHGDRTAIVCGSETRTFAQIYDRACRLVNALTALDVQQGDRVAALAAANITSLEQIAGLALGGFIRVPLNESVGRELHLHMLERVGATALIIDRHNFEILKDDLSAIPSLKQIIVQGSDGALDYETLLSEADPTDRLTHVRAEDPTHIMFTSGTTSRPKAVVHTHRGTLGATFDHLLLLPGLDAEDRYLAAMPLQSFPILAFALMLRGASTYVMPSYQPDLIPDLLSEQRITLTWLFPGLLEDLAPVIRDKNYDVSHLRAIFSAGGALSERALRTITEVFGDVVYLGYGQAEGNPATMLTPEDIRKGLDEDPSILRSAGHVVAGAAVRILDDDDRVRPIGAEGHIVIDPAGIMKELWADPETTAARFTSDRFLRTEDIGYLDSRGYLFVSGRSIDMIRHAGGMVAPADIEAVVAAHPDVAEVAAVGVPHGDAPEAPRAVVRLAEGAIVEETVLLAWCRKRLPQDKHPTSISFRDAPLPRNPVGKILRDVIRDEERDNATLGTPSRDD